MVDNIKELPTNDEIRDAFNELGKAFLDGFVKGLRNIQWDVVSLAREAKKARHRRRYFRMMERMKRGRK